MCTNFSTQNHSHLRRFYLTAGLVLLVLGLMLPSSLWAAPKTVTADVVILDHVLVFNRLGAQNVNGMIYALERDVIQEGMFWKLRPDKRARPLVLRVSAGDTLVVNFTNRLAPAANPNPPLPEEANPLLAPINDQVAGRYAGFHVQGLQLVGSIDSDASFVGQNPNSLVSAGGTTTYSFFAEKEGTFLVTSMGATFGGEATGGNVGVGAFGAVIVEPPLAKYYRSQVTEEELRLAGMKSLDPLSPDCGILNQTADGQPIIDYEARYPAQNCSANDVIVAGADGIAQTTAATTDVQLIPVGTADLAPNAVVVGPGANGTLETAADANDFIGTGNDLGATAWIAEVKDGLPILNILDGTEIVHADINAVIAGSNDDGSFVDGTYPGGYNPVYPNRLEAFREYVSIFSDEMAVTQAFPAWFGNPATNPLAHTLHGVRDSFMINYGSGGIGSEIIANRLGVGPMWDCLDCAYEEFFLTSFTVGDPAMLVDIPANDGLENCAPDGTGCVVVGPKATKAFYPDDPSNVHHGYTGDFVKFRNTHAGPKEQHIFHLHNHQWLFNPNDDNSNYIDAQGIGPGSGYTYELVNGGLGNRNKTAGDAIYHCHFYPHFAQGMWAHIRNHDVLETGTVLQVTPNTAGLPSGFHSDPWALKDGTPAHNGMVDVFGFATLGFETTTRALPDGEITVGTPIPAVVPLPGKPMAPMPAPVTVVVKNTNPGVDEIPDDATACAVDPTGPTCGINELPESSQANVTRVDANTDGVLDNPGYPFWIAGIDCGGADGLSDPTGCRDGIVGQRPATPPLDMLSDPSVLVEPGSPLANLLPDTDSKTAFTNAAGGFDGGLPRHALEGFRAVEAALDTGRGDPSIVEASASRLDFRKLLHKAKPVYYPEYGTDLERAAMAFHAQRTHPSKVLNLAGPPTPGDFITNGAPPVPGAPFQEPCVDDAGSVFNGSGNFFGQDGINYNFSGATKTATNPRVYQGANIQIEAVFNKVGYHFPQQRIISLWGDVAAYEAGTKPPEPFVIRMNTFDCTQYYHSNLVPNEYELDDYQVRTPTDIIGQHIHLPKWDLTTADGAANGWNYEDGTLSFMTVQERITAINHYNADPAFTPVPTIDNLDTGGTPALQTTLIAQPHPVLGTLGGRVTTQRWFADPVVNNDNEDRGLGIIFTHDHYGPSTHQQVGLYATVLTEPAGSLWKHNETGEAFGTRDDGGPSSWQAVITNVSSDGPGRPASDESYREFYLEFGDFQHAYEDGVAGIMPGAVPDAGMFRNAINPSFREQAIDGPGAGGILPDIVQFPPFCPDGSPRPCPEAISADDVGMLVVNYRNEPIGLRVFDPDKLGPDGKPGTQAGGLNEAGVNVNPDAGDLALALQSRADRAIPAMGTRLGNTPYPALTSGIGNGDPFTPMLRGFAGDLVRVKIQTGATEHEHNATIHGVKWLYAGSGHGAAPNSGWRNAQNAGISQQFTFSMPVIASLGQSGNQSDYAYSVDASQDGWWSGMWGLMRVYNNRQRDLESIGNQVPIRIANPNEFNGACPIAAPVQAYDLTAVLANDVLAGVDGVNGTGEPTAFIPSNLPVDDGTGNLVNDNVGGPLDPAGGTLVYNPRGSGDQAQFQGPLHDPTGMLYVHTADLVPVDALDPGCDLTDAIDPATGLPATNPAQLPDCPVELAAATPVEPVVLRAAAGDCIEVTLRNRLLEQAAVGTIDAGHPVGNPVFGADGNPIFVDKGQDLFVDDGTGTLVLVIDRTSVAFDTVPDLAGYNTLLQMVLRDRNGINGVTTFNNNLIRPSANVGLHPQLVAYDVTRDDGVVVGNNPRGQAIVSPGGTPKTYRWYAGDISTVPGRRNRVDLVATPVEFGGTNLQPADKIKQGQKGLVGALIIEPEGTAWTEDAGMRSAANVGFDSNPEGPDGVIDANETLFRDFTVVFQKGLNLRYGTDGAAVENIAGEGGAIPEDSHDAGQKAINYGTEPAWYRFGLAANTPFGNAGAGLGMELNAHQLYSNSLAGGDPATPVFTATAGQRAMMRLLMPTGVGRGTTFDLHGHLWQRDPYIEGAVPSQTIGENPFGLYLGHQESISPAAHFDIVLREAGGANRVPGDYLFRDHGSFGNTDGLWGIMRVDE